jgi:diguanylate cyclase (GGDEF)-like protein
MNTHTKKSTILLIDQDLSLTDILSNRLDNVGFNILVANTPDMAMKLLQISTPDIILLDLLMKTTDGKDILCLIKSNEITTNIPVIILSSDIDVNSKVYGFLSGANDYIVKPFRFAEVLARINSQLRILNMQKELEKKNQELLEKNILLEKLAITDSLTGLYNRAYILDRLNTEVLRCARYKEAISFLMVDVDFFKKINDTFGHLTGDAVLKIVSTQIKNSIRDVDVVGRYGGEEFIVICPNTDLAGATIIAERIRTNALNSNFSLGKNEISITLSVGVSSNIPKIQVNVEAFITKQIGDADIALYKAKSSGRNRVEVFDSMQAPTKPEQPINENQVGALSKKLMHGSAPLEGIAEKIKIFNPKNTNA